MADIGEMIGKEVEVFANGVKYVGILVEVSDTDVHIKTSLQWLSLPAVSVNSVRLAGVSEREPEREGMSSDE
jgi:hypothetical protein